MLKGFDRIKEIDRRRVMIWNRYLEK